MVLGCFLRIRFAFRVAFNHDNLTFKRQFFAFKDGLQIIAAVDSTLTFEACAIKCTAEGTLFFLILFVVQSGAYLSVHLTLATHRQINLYLLIRRV